MPKQEIINQQRYAVTKEAETWIDTPFYHWACVKGKKGGVDCIHLSAVYEKVLDINFGEWPVSFPSQWHLHEISTEKGKRFSEAYIKSLLDHGFVEIEKSEVLPGDVVLAKIGRVFCHGGIIVSWPWVIQAESNVYGAGKVVRANADANWFLSGKELRFFSLKEWHPDLC